MQVEPSKNVPSAHDTLFFMSWVEGASCVLSNSPMFGKINGADCALSHVHGDNKQDRLCRESCAEVNYGGQRVPLSKLQLAWQEIRPLPSCTYRRPWISSALPACAVSFAGVYKPVGTSYQKSVVWNDLNNGRWIRRLCIILCLPVYFIFESVYSNYPNCTVTGKKFLRICCKRAVRFSDSWQYTPS